MTLNLPRWMTDEELDPIVEAAGLDVEAWRQCVDGSEEDCVYFGNEFLKGSGIVVTKCSDAVDFLEWWVTELPAT